jgi:ABC-2 type transport system permease protein
MAAAMLLKHLKLLYRFAVISFRNMSEFRIDFMTSILHNVLYQAIFIIFWRSILSFTSESLGEWTFPELAILSAFSLLATAIMQWFVGLTTLSRKVLRGEVDKYLCKPVSPLLALLAEEMRGLASLQQVVSAGAILGGIAAYYDVPMTPASAVWSLLVLVVGCVVVVLIQGTIAMLAFWLGDVSRIQSLFMISGELERYPLTLFPSWLQQMMTWIIPIGLISTFPVLVLLGRVEMAASYLLIGISLLVVWGSIFSLMWSRALRRYESFGG